MADLKRVSFATTPDFELGFEHCARQTEYRLAMPDGDPQGLVVYIPGFGEDAGDYRDVFSQKIAQQHHLAAMTVDYHCFYSRPDDLQQALVFEAEDVALIEKLFISQNLPFEGSSPQEGLQALNRHLVEIDKSAQITATIKPGKEEYQNGGVMQALDIINAVEHALKNNPHIPAENIILVGSSYGGFIANLASKFAPNTFRAVFDNSSWATPHFGYVVGREYGLSEFNHQLHSHISVQCYVRSAWTLKKNLPNTFDGKRFYVRGFTTEQIAELAKYQPQTFYYFIHAENDTVASTESKIQMAREMIQHGMQVQMEVIEAADVDGQYIKTIEHGMDLSMLTFFSKAYQYIAGYQPETVNDFAKQSIIHYPSAECVYEFDFSSFPVKGRVLQQGLI